MFYMRTAAARWNESSTTFVVAWSRALQWWQKFKVSFKIKIPPNWVTSLLKMPQSCTALQFSQRRFTQVVTWGPSTTGWTSCVSLSFPRVPTAVGRRADVRDFWWTISFHLLSENRLWDVPDAEMLRFCAVASNFRRLRDDGARQKCQRSWLHFGRCSNVDRWIGNFRNEVDYDGTFCVLPQRDAVRITHGGAEMSGCSTISKFSRLLLCLSIQREYMRPHLPLQTGSQFRLHNYEKI